jgi:hypothetical protein
MGRHFKNVRKIAVTFLGKLSAPKTQCLCPDFAVLHIIAQNLNIQILICDGRIGPKHTVSAPQ